VQDWILKVFDHPADIRGAFTIVAKTVVIYVFLVCGLRLIGKRELGQMNLFDLVLIVVLGNAVQNAMMNNDNTLVGGLIAATTLLIVNRLLGILIKRSKKVERAMVGHAVLLINHGKILESNLRHEGISYEQLRQALREHGLNLPEEARLAVLEIDGSISVVPLSSEVLKTHRHYKALRLP